MIYKELLKVDEVRHGSHRLDTIILALSEDIDHVLCHLVSGCAHDVKQEAVQSFHTDCAQTDRSMMKWVSLFSSQSILLCV